jgi:hypothetical protein
MEGFIRAARIVLEGSGGDVSLNLYQADDGGDHYHFSVENCGDGIFSAIYITALTKRDLSHLVSQLKIFSDSIPVIYG